MKPQNVDSLVDLQKSKAILKNINWNFSQINTFSINELHPFNCRKHHWFPSTFVPELPFTLIEILTYPGALVYDPFGGIGTTYFQSLLLSRRPLTTENCRISLEFMKSLLILLNPNIKFESMRNQIKQLLVDFHENINYIAEFDNIAPNQKSIIEKLKPWYHPKTLNQLAYLFIKEDICDDTATKSAMRISISSMLKGLSCQEGGGSYVADNVKPKTEEIQEKDALKRFSQRINLLITDIERHIKNTDLKYFEVYNYAINNPTILHTDIRDNVEIPDDSIDLVITSPPYPNMSDYVRSQRLSYYWFETKFSDMGFLNDFNREIGARNKRSKKDALEQYAEDMKKANKIITSKIKVGGYACYVLPAFNLDENNTKRKKIVQDILIDLQHYSLELEGTFERIIPAKRRYHGKWATLEKEKIYFFRKIE